MRSGIATASPSFFPPVQRQESFVCGFPVGRSGVGQPINFPSRTDRGDWPVVGLATNYLLGGTNSLGLRGTYIVLKDRSGDVLIQDMPLSRLCQPRFGTLSGGWKWNTFAWLRICWEKSYYYTNTAGLSNGGFDLGKVALLTVYYKDPPQ